MIAGSGDGPCYRRQGGLGMFQFDAGTHSQTLRAYGRDVLTVEGNTRDAVTYVINRVVINARYIPASNRAQAIKWLNNIRVGDANYNRYVNAVTDYYNGCIWNNSLCRSRFRAYDKAIRGIHKEFGSKFWNVSGVKPPPGGGKPGCKSGTLGRNVVHGACVQMNYATGCGKKCSWAACSSGNWVCKKGPKCAKGKGKNHPHKACGATTKPKPKPKPGANKKKCPSSTLGRKVWHGGCVQMPYKSGCGNKCAWAACSDGQWVCRKGPKCAWGSGKNHPHKSCKR